MRRSQYGLAVFLFVGLLFILGGVGASLSLENQDAFCASCHTEPEVAYYQQSLEKNPGTLAAFHTQKETTCIDCHSGSGILGRGQGLAQGASDLVAYVSGNYRHPAVTSNPLGDDSCLKCHGDVVASRNGDNRSLNGHYHFFLPRWQAADPQAAHCITCHTGHVKELASLAFMAQGPVGRVCDSCHSALSGTEGGNTR